MPHVNGQILTWARETAGLTREQAVEKLEIKDARGVSALDRLILLESEEEAPSRAMLVKMAKHYRRPLIAFYLSGPPRKGDRGEDFRTLPAGHSETADALLDALIRDVRARQSIVRSVLEDEEELEPRSFVGSAGMSDGVARIVESIRAVIGVRLTEFRSQPSAEDAFAYLRNHVESAGVFVLLIGNLGSHHTAIDLETFRGFALADPIAPFIIINDQDAKSAWSFSLLHELAHVWLGTTGVSSNSGGAAIEQFCNDVAGEFLLPTDELAAVNISDRTDLAQAAAIITEFADNRRIGRSMVAYKLLRNNIIAQRTWRQLSTTFHQEWLHDRAASRERDRHSEGGPSYYVVRRHRLGQALLSFVQRTMSDGALSPTKAGKVLGVKPRNVAPLLSKLGPVGAGRSAEG